MQGDDGQRRRLFGLKAGLFRLVLDSAAAQEVSASVQELTALAGQVSVSSESLARTAQALRDQVQRLQRCESG